MKKMRLFYLLPAVLVVVSCTKDPVEPEQVSLAGSSELTLASDESVEAANPAGSTDINEVYFAGNKIPVENYNGNFVYQGDILLSSDMVTKEPVKLVLEKGETPSAVKSVGRTSGRWPNNTVYFSIESGLDNKQRVYDAITHWESKTNLDFVERSTQSNYIYFVTGSGCSSYVGMIGGRQNITLSSTCSTGNTIHEIGHAIGLWHEQSRVDREQFVIINYANIESGREHNFYTYEHQGFDGDEFTSSLDFGSIMMYGSYSFSANGRPTLVKKDGSTFNIQRSGLSSGDVVGVNNMYPYSSPTVTSTEPVYVNGQYYTIAGVTVFRSAGKWYYYSRSYGWKQVKLSSIGYWYYV